MNNRFSAARFGFSSAALVFTLPFGPVHAVPLTAFMTPDAPLGVQLGLGYAYYGTAYLATRGTHPVRLTAGWVDESSAYFTLDGGHRRDLPWDTVLTYLCSGRDHTCRRIISCRSRPQTRHSSWATMSSGLSMRLKSSSLP